MRELAWVAFVLLVVWFVAVVAFKVVGAAIHLALAAAVVLFAIWAFQRFTGHRV